MKQRTYFGFRVVKYNLLPLYYFLLTEEYGPERGFDLLWTNAELDAEGTRMVLRDGVGLEDEKAKKIAEVMHPDEPRETYLVLTMNMMRRLGLYEYYADWDFSGTQEKPLSTSYQSHPDGSGQLDLEDDTDPDTARRKKETIWRLFLDRDGVEDELMIRFERVYEVTDGVEQVQVWRVLPGVVAYMPWLEEDNNQRTDS